MKIKKPYFETNKTFAENIYPRALALNNLLRGVRYLFKEPDIWKKYGTLTSLFINRAEKYLFRESLLPKLIQRIDAAYNLYDMAMQKNSDKVISLFIEFLPFYSGIQESSHNKRESVPLSDSYIAQADDLIDKYVFKYESELGTLLSFLIGCRRIFANQEFASVNDLIETDSTLKFIEIEKSIISLNNPISIFRTGSNPHLRNAKSHGIRITHYPEELRSVIGDRKGYREKFSLEKIRNLLEELSISVDAIEISLIIFQMNYHEDIRKNPLWESRALTVSELEANISVAADMYGFDFIKGEEADQSTYWLLFKIKPGAASREETEGELIIGLKRGAIRVPIKEPSFNWNTRENLLGTVFQIANALPKEYSSLVIELQEDARLKKRYLRVNDLKGFIREIKLLGSLKDKVKAKQKARKVIEPKFIETNIND